MMAARWKDFGTSRWQLAYQATAASIKAKGRFWWLNRATQYRAPQYDVGCLRCLRLPPAPERKRRRQLRTPPDGLVVGSSPTSSTTQSRATGEFPPCVAGFFD